MAVPDRGSPVATSRPGRRLYGRSRSCHRSCDFRQIFITEAAIPSLALERHAGKERHATVDVVIDDYLTLGVVLPVQPTDVLRERAAPRDRHGQKKCVKRGIVEAFAEVAARRKYEALLGVRRLQELLCLAALRSAHSAVEDNQVLHEVLESAA